MVEYKELRKGVTLLKKKSDKRLTLVRLDRDGKGVGKNELETHGFRGFFRSYFDNFGKIFVSNILMVLGNFPVVFLIAAFAGVSQGSKFLPRSDVFQNLSGLLTSGETTPASLSAFSLIGLQRQTNYFTPTTWVLIGIGLLTLFTFGLVNCGTAYVFRNLASGEPVFVWTDFKYAIKSNLKQALIYGFIDCAILFILGFNIYSTFTGGDGSFLTSFMFWSNAVLLLVYFVVRFYMYVQIVTFKLSTFKMFKNGFIFTLLGFKRNITVLGGCLVLTVFELMLLFGLGSVLVPFAVAAPLTILFSTFAYMKIYASYYVIKKYMIDPYLAEHPEEKPEKPEDEEEPIMRDDVTEARRLEEIKRRNGIID